MKFFPKGLFSAGLLILISVSFFNLGASSPGKFGNPVALDISRGAGFNEIVESVYQKGLIRAPLVFKIYAGLTGKAHKIKSGYFEIENPVSVPELLNILIRGPLQISATIFPGMTLKEADDLLAAKKIIKNGELENYNAGALEGFLLPDTYIFYQGSGAEAVAKKILINFENKFSSIIGEEKRKSGEFKEALIIASILEKEIPDGEERKIAAGVLYKRLAVGMPLQVDASVVYVKCGGRFLNCPALSKSDYSIDSPHNTYLHSGLPPAPISNPSIGAIKAVFEKKDSPYWYYLSDPKTKKTIFSKTLDEHNKNRIKYLSIQ